MMATRLKQFGLLLFSMLICGVAFFQMFERTTGGFPQNYLWMLAFVGALFLTSWGLPLRFQPYANQAIMCCVMVLTGTGIMMIARIDQDSNTSVAFKQLLWLSIALVLANLLVIFMKDYRVLRRFSYVSMVIGLVLLLSPMLPVIGSEQYGARIWVKIPGLGSFQPSEFAKLFLAFFFASYLYDHRDQLAVGGKKVLGLQLPRIKDLGPIIVVWIVSMGVLVVQHDLGTSLMFFAMFVSMLYVATGRTSWIVIGFIAFAVGAFAAAKRGSKRFVAGLAISWKRALQRSHRLSEVLLKRSSTIKVWAKLSLCPIPSLVSTPFKAQSSGKINGNSPHLSSKSKPIEGFGERTILFNSSTIRSLEMMEIRSRLRMMRQGDCHGTKDI